MPRTCESCGATLMTAPDALCPRCLLAAAVVRRNEPRDAPVYQILAPLGAGPQGLSYLGTAEAAGSGSRLVVLKVLTASGGLEELRDEVDTIKAAAAAAAGQSSILAPLDAGTTHEGAACVVREFVPGSSLAAWCRQPGRSAGERRAVIDTVAAAIARAHEAGFAHGNLKPENVIVTSASTVRLVDPRPGASRADDDQALANLRRLLA